MQFKKIPKKDMVISYIEQEKTIVQKYKKIDLALGLTGLFSIAMYAALCLSNFSGDIPIQEIMTKFFYSVSSAAILISPFIWGLIKNEKTYNKQSQSLNQEVFDLLDEDYLKELSVLVIDDESKKIFKNLIENKTLNINQKNTINLIDSLNEYNQNNKKNVEIDNIVDKYLNKKIVHKKEKLLEML